MQKRDMARTTRHTHSVEEAPPQQGTAGLFIASAVGAMMGGGAIAAVQAMSHESNAKKIEDKKPLIQVMITRNISRFSVPLG